MSKVNIAEEVKNKQAVETYRLKKEKEKRITQYRSVQQHDFYIDKSRSIAVTFGAEDIKKITKSKEPKHGIYFEVSNNALKK